MGVHYAYIWVGTPAQRVTVIVDTGSHHTAFPCVGCKCGKHVRVYVVLCCCCMSAMHSYVPYCISPLRYL